VVLLVVATVAEVTRLDEYCAIIENWTAGRTHKGVGTPKRVLKPQNLNTNSSFYLIIMEIRFALIKIMIFQ
jgi:hypothetical protein